MKEVETNFTDIFGNEIKEGDIVVRAIYSDLTFHKVIKITKKGVYLSRRETTHTRETYWYYNETERRYMRNDVARHYSWTVYGGGVKIEDVETHTGSIYVRKELLSLVLVTNKVYNN